MSEPVIDWSNFDGVAPFRVSCTCGKVYDSHAKMVIVNGRKLLMSRHPCPACGANNKLDGYTASDHSVHQCW